MDILAFLEGIENGTITVRKDYDEYDDGIRTETWLNGCLQGEKNDDNDPEMWWAFQDARDKSLIEETDIGGWMARYTLTEKGRALLASGKS